MRTRAKEWRGGWVPAAILLARIIPCAALPLLGGGCLWVTGAEPGLQVSRNLANDALSTPSGRGGDSP